MQIGASMFFTDYSMAPAELGKVLEDRGFDSVWAPEHSHIPLSRKTPWGGGGELPKHYYDAMDPFVSLTAAAGATKNLKLATGVCLVAQRDPIQTAKLVASLDQVSGGRFLFGIGNGWNQDEMENHGTVYASRHKLARERVEAMKLIWTKSKPEYHGEFVNFDPMMAWPKPVQKPHPPILVGGAFPYAARRAARYGDGWMPIRGRTGHTEATSVLPQYKDMLKENNRTIGDAPLSLFGAPPDLDALKKDRDLGVVREVVTLPSEKADKVMPIIDKWAELIVKLGK